MEGGEDGGEKKIPFQRASGLCLDSEAQPAELKENSITTKKIS